MIRLEAFPRYFSWRLLRWFVVGLSLPLALMAIVLSVTIWRLEQTPLEVTPLVQYWQPVTLQFSKDQPPIGHVRWGKAFLSWTPHMSHLPAGVMLQADQLEVVQTDGRVVDRLKHASAVLNIAALFRGHLAFRAVRISGAEFTLKRYKDGTVSPNIAGFPHQSTVPQQTPTWVFIDGDALRVVDITHLSMTMTDEQRPQNPLHFHMPSLQVKYHHALGWSGHMKGIFHWGNNGIPFQINMQPGQQKQTHFKLKIGSFVPARLAEWLPNMKAEDAARWQLPVEMKAEGDVVPEGMGGRPVRLWTEFLIGQGEILQPGHSPLIVQHGHARFDVKWQGVQPLQHIALDEGQVDLTLFDSQRRPVSVVSSARINIDDLVRPKRIDVEVKAHIPQFDFATLSSIWPRGSMKGARRWMTANIAEGRGENLDINAHLHSEVGFKKLKVAALQGHLTGHGLEIHWLRPVQPVTRLEANAYFLTPDTLKIDVKKGTLSDGQQGEIAVPKGEIILSGLMKKDQYANIKLGVEGAFPSFLNVLSHPRLHLLSTHDVGVRHPTGDIKGTLGVSVWLDKRVKARDIGFSATAECQNLALESVDIGTIKQGKGLLTVSSKGLNFHGKADIRGLPVHLSVMDSFQDNEAGRVLRHITAQTQLDNAGLASFGLALPSGVFSGVAPISAEYVQKGLGTAHRQSDVHINIDLTPVSVKIASWMKPKNSASSLEGHVRLLDNSLQSLDHILVKGPFLAASGQGVIKRHRVSGLNFNHIVFNRNEGRAQILWPIGPHDPTPYQVNVHAKTLDASPWLHSHKAAKETSSAILAQPQKRQSVFPAGAWRVAVQTHRLFYTQERAMTDVRAQLDWSHHVLDRAYVTAVGPDSLSARFVTLPGEKIEHKLDVDISNIGALINDLGVYQHIDAGHVRLDGVFAAAPEYNTCERVGWGVGLGPFTGHIEGENIAFSHTPSVLTVATFLSPFHWGQLGRKRFDKLKASVLIHINDEKMTITDGYMSNAILGGTVEGALDFKTSQLALNGTVSPFFRMNYAAGNIFGLRSFFAPEKGSGMVAMTYKLKGSFAQPSFKINPLSVLLPGELRQILK